MTILIDNGHGQETPGKQSPDGQLKEWQYTRQIADLVVERLKAECLDARLLTPEDNDIALAERVRRANAICKKEGKRNCLVVSIHLNASGADGKWHTPNGWQVFVANNAGANSKYLAYKLYARAAAAGLRGNRAVPRERYWTQNLAICRDTACPAVLTENLFQDNRHDCQWLLTEEGRDTIADIHVRGILDYIG